MMKLCRRTVTRALAVAALAISVPGLLPGSHGPARAGEFRAGDIVIDHPWARATPGRARNGAAFMKVVNLGGTADRLMEVRGDVSERTSLHTHIHEEGVTRMRPSGPVRVPANGDVVMQPGGYHVMMLGLKAPLVEGGRFPLTLVFEKAGEVTVEVLVRGVGAGAVKTGAGKTGHGSHGH